MRVRTVDATAALVLGSGVLMAGYLLIRPYGDLGTDLETVNAIASQRWVVAHVCGMLALGGWALAVVRVARSSGGGAVARVSAVAGLVAVLPYYGLETFALHVVARDGLASPGATADLIAQIREQPVAMVIFGVGLLALMVSGVAFALHWQRASASRAIAAWPLGLAVVMFPPQFFLPEALRMAYGVLYLVAALALAAAVLDRRIRVGNERPLAGVVDGCAE